MARSFRKMGLMTMDRLMESALDQAGISYKLLEYKAPIIWAEVVGPQIAAATHAQKVMNGILFVACKSSVWASELESAHKVDIIKSINRKLKQEIVKDIHFSSKGYRNGSKSKDNEIIDNLVKDLDKMHVDESILMKADKPAGLTQSEELSNRIKKAVQTSLKLKEYKLKEGWKKCPKCHNLHDGPNDICDPCR